MWYETIKRFYDNGHQAYTKESLKAFVVAEMITVMQYKEITNTHYTQ